MNKNIIQDPVGEYGDSVIEGYANVFTGTEEGGFFLHGKDISLQQMRDGLSILAAACRGASVACKNINGALVCIVYRQEGKLNCTIYDAKKDIPIVEIISNNGNP